MEISQNELSHILNIALFITSCLILTLSSIAWWLEVKGREQGKEILTDEEKEKFYKEHPIGASIQVLDRNAMLLIAILSANVISILAAMIATSINGDYRQLLFSCLTLIPTFGALMARLRRLKI